MVLIKESFSILKKNKPNSFHLENICPHRFCIKKTILKENTHPRFSPPNNNVQSSIVRVRIDNILWKLAACLKNSLIRLKKKELVSRANVTEEFSILDKYILKTTPRITFYAKMFPVLIPQKIQYSLSQFFKCFSVISNVRARWEPGFLSLNFISPLRPWPCTTTASMMVKLFLRK